MLHYHYIAFHRIRCQFWILTAIDWLTAIVVIVSNANISVVLLPSQAIVILKCQIAIAGNVANAYNVEFEMSNCHCRQYWFWNVVVPLNCCHRSQILHNKLIVFDFIIVEWPAGEESVRRLFHDEMRHHFVAWHKRNQLTFPHFQTWKNKIKNLYYICQSS